MMWHDSHWLASILLDSHWLGYKATNFSSSCFWYHKICDNTTTTTELFYNFKKLFVFASATGNRALGIYEPFSIVTLKHWVISKSLQWVNMELWAHGSIVPYTPFPPDNAPVLGKLSVLCYYSYHHCVNISVLYLCVIRPPLLPLRTQVERTSNPYPNPSPWL